MEADRLAVAFGVRDPAAGLEQRGLFVLADAVEARGALAVDVAQVVACAQLLEFEDVLMAAVRARHVVMALIALRVELGDARGTVDRRRTCVVKLGVAPEGAGALFGDADGVAFVVEVAHPTVDFVAVHVARGDFGQVGG